MPLIKKSNPNNKSKTFIINALNRKYIYVFFKEEYIWVNK